MTITVRHPSTRCMCWLTYGKHELSNDRLTGAWVCIHCGADGNDAMAASTEYQQAYTEYHELDFLKDEREREDRPQRSALLRLPSHLKRMFSGGK